MKKIKKEAEIKFEQPLMVMRVIETEKSEYDIEVAMYDGPSIGTTEPNEFIAKTITEGLLKAYIEGLKELQEKMVKSLSNIQDENRSEDESSKSSIEDKQDSDI